MICVNRCQARHNFQYGHCLTTFVCSCVSAARMNDKTIFPLGEINSLNNNNRSESTPRDGVLMFAARNYRLFKRVHVRGDPLNEREIVPATECNSAKMARARLWGWQEKETSGRWNGATAGGKRRRGGYIRREVASGVGVYLGSRTSGNRRPFLPYLMNALPLRLASFRFPASSPMNLFFNFCIPIC